MHPASLRCCAIKVTLRVEPALWYSTCCTSQCHGHHHIPTAFLYAILLKSMRLGLATGFQRVVELPKAVQGNTLNGYYRVKGLPRSAADLRYAVCMPSCLSARIRGASSEDLPPARAWCACSATGRMAPMRDTCPIACVTQSQPWQQQLQPPLSRPVQHC